jgi:hypothetical protein
MDKTEWVPEFPYQVTRYKKCPHCTCIVLAIHYTKHMCPQKQEIELKKVTKYKRSYP